MNRTTAKIVLIAFGLMIVWLAFVAFVKILQLMLILVVGIAIIGLAYIGFRIYDKISSPLKNRAHESRLAKLLHGRSKQEVLADADHTYGHFQGENGYRIYSKDSGDEFVKFVATSEEAELWIIEEYFKSRSTSAS